MWLAHCAVFFAARRYFLVNESKGLGEDKLERTQVNRNQGSQDCPLDTLKIQNNLQLLILLKLKTAHMAAFLRKESRGDHKIVMGARTGYPHCIKTRIPRVSITDGYIESSNFTL